MARSRRRPARRGGALPAGTIALLDRALEEDGFRSDRTTRGLFPGPIPATARVTVQATGTLSGVGVALALARRVGLGATALRHDGDRIHPGTAVLVLRGDARRILSAERTMLNVLMHLSGIATATARARATLRAAGASRVEIRATRKTIPGLRDLEKAAVVDGGGSPHRRNLSDAVLVKNNHLAILPLAESIRRLRTRRFPVEVEVRSLAEATVALDSGARELLLDNLSPAAATRLVRSLRRRPGGRKIRIEISGGLTPATVHRYAHVGADSLSLGSITHSASALPFHLTLRRARRLPRRRDGVHP